MANVMTPSCRQLRFTRALEREIGHTRGGSPVHALSLPQLRFRIGVAGLPHRRRQRQADDRCRRPAMPAARSSASRSRAHSTAAPNVRRCYSDSTPQGLRAAPGQLPRRTQSADGRTVQRRPAAPGLRRRRQERLVHRGDVPRAGHGRRRSGPRGDAGVLRRRARTDASAHGSLFLVDSIQAGLRAHGVLSIDRLPGLREASMPPDMETYSKAINGGQYSAVGACGQRQAPPACTARASTATR